MITLASLTAALVSLSPTLPALSGVLWLDNNVVCLSGLGGAVVLPGGSSGGGGVVAGSGAPTGGGAAGALAFDSGLLWDTAGLVWPA